MLFRQVIIILALAIPSTFCANILFVTLVSSRSHHKWNEALVQKLLEGGHQITLIGHEESDVQNENYTLFQIEGAKHSYYDIVQRPSLYSWTAIENIYSVWDYNYYICQHNLKSQALKDLMKFPRDHFDLMVYDLHSGQCLYPLIEYFGNPPILGVSAFGLPPFIADVIGAHVYSYIPFYTLPYSDKMNRWQRGYNKVLQTLDSIIKWCFYMPPMYMEAQKYFHEDIKYFQEVERQVSILLTNNDPILDYPQPFPPNIIPVGGMHINKIKKLDLETVFEKSDRVIYVSIATDIIQNHMNSGTIEDFLQVFNELNETILWAYEDETIKVPKNVIVRKWFPQNDILGNKKVKLFITHCGWLSIQEAIYHGVPLIGIPVFIDHHNNAAKILSKTIGKTLDYKSLNSRILHESIREVIDNLDYKNRIDRLSKLFQDQPQSPLDRAVFWMEYILRNNNSEHFNTAERFLPWYEKISTEVLIIAALSLILFVYAMQSIYVLTVSAIYMNNEPVKTKKKKHKTKQS
nr:UDP-glucuronosyltransferase 2B15-like [Onthophagus taurus]